MNIESFAWFGFVALLCLGSYVGIVIDKRLSKKYGKTIKIEELPNVRCADCEHCIADGDQDYDGTWHNISHDCMELGHTIEDPEKEHKCPVFNNSRLN